MKHLLFGFALIISLSAYGQNVNSIGMEMVGIPAGSFLMGDAGLGNNYDEAPAHKVNIQRAFRIGATEVTNAQFEQFMPSHRELRGKNGFSLDDDEAVIFVSWNEAMDFCRWLSEKEGKTYRLPTEAEWEYVCKAGTNGWFSIGDRGLPGVLHKNQVQTADPVPVSLKSTREEPNPFGVYDIHGNVEEWCLDWYGPYDEAEKFSPAGPAKGISKVVRGGSHNTPSSYMRSANRSSLMPDGRTVFTGFRVVEVLEDEELSYTDVPDVILPAKALRNFKWKKTDKPFFAKPVNFLNNDDIPYVEGFFSHNHCPAATWLPNGDLFVVWFSTEDERDREMTVLSARLKAGERTWSRPELFFKIADRNMTGSALFYDEESGLLYHFNGVEAAGTWKNLACVVRTSADNGYTWSEPHFVNPEHETGNQVIAGTIKTSKGYLIQACDATPEGSGGTILHVSKDGGKTWYRTDEGKESEVPAYEEGAKGHRIAGIHAGVVELKDGSLLAFGRQDNIRKEGEDRMPQSISKDMGATWTYSATEFPPIAGGQRLILRRLNEGPLLLVSFTDWWVEPRNIKGMKFTDSDGTFTGYGMYAAVSYDEGKTWPVRKLITDGEDCYRYGGAFTGWFKSDSCHAETKGYLAATQSPDNMIHIFSSALHYQFNLQWLEK